MDNKPETMKQKIAAWWQFQDAPEALKGTLSALIAIVATAVIIIALMCLGVAAIALTVNLIV